MTSEEIKQAMINGSPVRYKGIDYEGITAYIYRRIMDRHTGKVSFILQCELLDRSGNAVVFVDAKKVEMIK